MTPSSAPRTRRLKLIKWSGVAATALLAFLWLTNLRYGLRYFSTPAPPGALHTFIFCTRGSLAIGRLDATTINRAQASGWSFYPMRDGRFVWWIVYTSNTTMTFVSIPYWLIALPLTVTAWRAWILDARAERLARPGRCPACRYDRSGLPPDALCPECGTPQAIQSS